MKIAGSDVDYDLARWADDWVSSIAYDLDDSSFTGRDDQGRRLPGVFDPLRMLYSPDNVKALREDREEAQKRWGDARPAVSRGFWRRYRLHIVSPAGHGMLTRLEVTLELP